MIELPYPAKELSPNSRCHWSQKARLNKIARKDAALLAKVAGFSELTFTGYDGKLHLWIDIYCKTKNYVDADNALSSCKSMIDGIADALGVNDRRFVHHPFVKDETHKGGKVIIRITKGSE